MTDGLNDFTLTVFTDTFAPNSFSLSIFPCVSMSHSAPPAEVIRLHAAPTRSTDGVVQMHPDQWTFPSTHDLPTTGLSYTQRQFVCRMSYSSYV